MVEARHAGLSICLHCGSLAILINFSGNGYSATLKGLMS